jgi:hypothetical protein
MLGEEWSLSGMKTSGFMITSRGLMKWIDHITDENTISYIAKHFEISYAHSEYETSEEGHPLDNTKFSGITISVFGY